MYICVIMKVIKMYIWISAKVVEMDNRPSVHFFEIFEYHGKTFFTRRGFFPFRARKKTEQGRSENASRFEQSQGRESPESEMDVETPQEDV